MALRFDSGAILLGETRCLSHSGHKGLITFDHVTSAFCCWALSISLAMRSSVRLLDITLTFFCNSYCKIMFKKKKKLNNFSLLIFSTGVSSDPISGKSMPGAHFFRLREGRDISPNRYFAFLNFSCKSKFSLLHLQSRLQNK